MTVLLTSLEPLVDALRGQGYRVVGPTVANDAIVLPALDLPALLAAARENPRWAEVTTRALTCGNCTMVCPTCCRTTVIDDTEVAGGVARRAAVWDSRFDPEFSYPHGGAVRTTARGRYRHWLSHMFGTWRDQFGESGRVGRGRRIVWCPVGIDVTEELHALAQAGPAGSEGE